MVTTPGGWQGLERRRERSLEVMQNSKIDAMLHRVMPHSLWHQSRIFDLMGSLFSHDRPDGPPPPYFFAVRTRIRISSPGD